LSNDGAAGAAFENFASNLENVIGGSGNDALSGTSANQTLVGNGGDDTLSGFGGNDCLSGNAGNANLAGGGGNDNLHRRTGDDTLDADAGDDTFFGEEGSDTADYSDRFFGQNLSIDNVANDGDPFGNEKDNIQTDVENVTGGIGNDSIQGSSTPNS